MSERRNMQKLSDDLLRTITGGEMREADKESLLNFLIAFKESGHTIGEALKIFHTSELQAFIEEVWDTL